MYRKLANRRFWFRNRARLFSLCLMKCYNQSSVICQRRSECLWAWYAGDSEMLILNLPEGLSVKFSWNGFVNLKLYFIEQHHQIFFCHKSCKDLQTFSFNCLHNIWSNLKKFSYNTFRNWTTIKTQSLFKRCLAEQQQLNMQQQQLSMELWAINVSPFKQRHTTWDCSEEQKRIIWKFRWVCLTLILFLCNIQITSIYFIILWIPQMLTVVRLWMFYLFS